VTLLTLAEAKTSLNITSATYDSELQDYIDGTIAAVEYLCGPSASTAATEVLHGVGALVLTNTPVLTLTSITGDLMGVRDLTYIRFDADTGVVRAKANVIPLLPDWYTVVYTYGRASVPVALKQAAKVILKHQWSTQRGPSSRPSDVDAPPGSANRTMIPGLGYALPNAALQMLAEYQRGPAVGG
jgi:hypothetical protein